MTEARGSQHPRPLNIEFYRSARDALAVTQVQDVRVLEVPGPATVDVKRGDAVSLRLPNGPQIVNLFAYNSADPDERLWAHETLLVEGMFLGRYSRLWGTMARFRPLLAVLEDTVTGHPTAVAGSAKHHVIHGGSGTPADWKLAGGPSDRPSTWEQLVAGLEERGLPPTLLKDNASFFEKARIDSYTQRLEMLPSDAIAGDAVTLFAEVDVTLVLALSPYVDGTLAAPDLGGLSPRPVEIVSHGHIAEPMAWPYPDMGYPDLSLYLGPDGSRSRKVGPTPGRESSV